LRQVKQPLAGLAGQSFLSFGEIRRHAFEELGVER
jgi:hypothetical protein